MKTENNFDSALSLGKGKAFQTVWKQIFETNCLIEIYRMITMSDYNLNVLFELQFLVKTSFLPKN